MSDEEDRQLDTYKRLLFDLKGAIHQIQGYMTSGSENTGDESVDNVENLYRRLDLVENALESILNWVTLQKNTIKGTENLYHALEVVYGEKNVDTIRNRIRTFIIPQLESFSQNLETTQKASRLVMKAIDTKVTDELVKELSSEFKYRNLLLLTAIGFDPEINTSDLSTIAESLYQGDLERSKDLIIRLKSRVQGTQKFYKE